MGYVPIIWLKFYENGLTIAGRLVRDEVIVKES